MSAEPLPRPRAASVDLHHIKAARASVMRRNEVADDCRLPGRSLPVNGSGIAADAQPESRERLF